MRLQKRLNRVVGNKEYSKWIVNIPTDMIDQAGLKEGDELEAIAKRHEILLKLNKKKK